MKLILQYNLETSIQSGNKLAFQYYAANPFMLNGNIYYPHGTGIIGCRKISLDGRISEMNFGVMPGCKVDWPRNWIIFEYEGHAVLSCGETEKGEKSGLFLDLDDNMRQLYLPEDIRQRVCLTKMVKETEDVKLSNWTMHYKTSRSYQCLDSDGKVLWTEKHKGYRYTPFEEKNDCVIFGTAEFGGGLYCYRLSDGECLCFIDTKGTPNYCWQKDLIVCHSRAGSLIWVDPFSGEVKSELCMDCIFTDSSGYWADERYVCAVGFKKKTNSPCIYLIDSMDEKERG